MPSQSPMAARPSSGFAMIRLLTSASVTTRSALAIAASVAAASPAAQTKQVFRSASGQICAADGSVAPPVSVTEGRGA